MQNFPVGKELILKIQQTIKMHSNIFQGTVLPVKSDSDVMFCLQSNQGLRINISLVY